MQFEPFFLNPEGMRFHLPAFIIAELKRDFENVVFSLTQLDDYKQSMFAALNPDQHNAVRLFLEYCLSQEVYSDDHEDIRNALNVYWHYR